MAALLLMLAGSLAVARAQAWLQTWMTAPEADKGAEVLYRRTLSLDARPQRAWITIATTGRYDLYVNGRNVSRCSRLPLRESYSTAAMASTHDITGLLRPGENTVLISTAPTYYNIGSAALSVTIFGDCASGKPLLLSGTDGWFVRQGSRRLLADGGESQDATRELLPWAEENFCVMRWLPASSVCNNLEDSVRYLPKAEEGESIVLVGRPHHFNAKGDTVTYDFGTAFHGFLRVTLRGCRRGERISVGGLEYTCTGELDEQAFRRWTATDLRRITISGSGGFRRDQIQSVEAIVLGTRPRSADFR